MRSFSLVACTTVGLGGLLGAVVACSTSATANNTGDVAAACGTYFDSLAKRSADCAAQKGTPVSGEFTPDTRDNFIRQCTLSLGAPGSGVSPSVLNACVAELDKQPAGCLSSGVEDVSACQPPPGTLAVGAACADSAQCQSGSCSTNSTQAGDAGADGGASTSASFCGVCVATLAEGADCSAPAAVCARGLACTGGKCAKRPAPVAEGGNCVLKDGTKTTILTCQSGLSCSVATSGGELTGTCKREPVKGEACTTRCKSPFVCATGTCADALGEGADCTSSNVCNANLYCDTAGTKKCKAYTVAAAGAPCGNVGVRCDSKLSCVRSGTTGTCMAPIAAGGACTVDSGAPCSAFTSCIAGTCQFEDPAVCK